MLFAYAYRLALILVIVFIVLLSQGCAGFTPEPIMGTITSDSLQSIDDINNTVNTYNISWKYVALIALGFWCIRTPWRLIGDALRYFRGGLL